MSGEEGLTDKDPFEEDQGEDLITEAMVKKATYLIHKLATRKGADYKDIQNKCKKLFAYTNLAKVSREEGHEIINKLIELTGGEEEKPALDPTVKDNLTHEKTVQEPARKEEDVVTATMREAIRAAVDITMTEVVNKDVPVMGLGGFVLDVGKVIFEVKMKASVEK